MKFTAAGDMIIQRKIQKDFEGFSELTPFILEGDASFFNLETTLNHEGECPSSQLSGGTYIRTNPEVLDDIKQFGFNMTSFNNNHALDFSSEGLIRTLDTLNKSGLVHAGVGRNLAEASAPKYLETKNGRVALISVNTTFDEYMLAGEQTPRVLGRPGINGLRTETIVVVEKEDIESIRKIVAKTGINAYNDITRREGYLTELPENVAELGKMRFVAGDKPCCKVTLNSHDMERIEKSIDEAAFQADYVIISVHSHELSGTSKETPAEFLKVRSKDFTHGLMEDRRMFLSVIPLWEAENGKHKSLRLMPIEAMMEGNESEIGLPRRSDGKDIAEYLGEMCKPYGTKVTLEDDGILTVTW